LALVEDHEFENYQKYRHMPLYDDYPLSFLGFSLNSTSYQKEVYRAEGFHEIEPHIDEDFSTF